jgi:hypothetical protein
MMRTRIVLVMFALGTSAACGGDDDDFDAPTEVPDGPHHTFVVSRIDLPTSSAETSVLALDLDGEAQDGPENQLGQALGTAEALVPGLRQQEATDRAIDRGDSTMYLMSLRGPSLAGGPLELHTMFGSESDPEPCLDENDTTCRRHLGGDATIATLPMRPTVPLTGVHEDGAYLGRAGDAWIPIPVGFPGLFLHASRARVQLDEISPTALRGRIGGMIDVEELQAVMPQLYWNVLLDLVARDCEPGGPLPDCGCAPNSEGDAALIVDSAPQDCEISLDEVVSAMSSLVTPDMDVDGDLHNESVSFVIGFEAVPARFTP